MWNPTFFVHILPDSENDMLACSVIKCLTSI